MPYHDHAGRCGDLSQMRLLSIGLCLLLAVLWAQAAPVEGAFLYKTYLVQQDRGVDILCDPYIVQPNDYVLKIFRRKGEIAHSDFQEFLDIFRRINPQVQDINIVRPGQQIIIPIKKLQPNTFPGQATGIVTIPFVTIQSAPDLIKSHTVAYEVQQGDTVSVLLSRMYGAKYGSQAYQEGLQLFQASNPDLKDINLIHPGQVLKIPDQALRNQEWYESLFDNTGNLRLDEASVETAAARGPVPRPQAPQNTTEAQQPQTPFQEAAAILNAKLYDKGSYFFPGQDGSGDFALNLAEYPVMELMNNQRVLFTQEIDILPSDKQVIQSHWDNIQFAMVAADPTVNEILASAFESIQGPATHDGLTIVDEGITVQVRARWVNEERFEGKTKARYTCISLLTDVKEQTAKPIRRYLANHDIILKELLQGRALSVDEGQQPVYKIPDEEVLSFDSAEPKAFVNRLVQTLDYQYATDVQISFPYAGIQVEAVTDLISANDGTSLLVDYGNLYGEALDVIRKSGLKIIQVVPQTDLQAVLDTVFTALRLPYAVNPTFMAAKRPAEDNTSLTIPGFLIEPDPSAKVLLTQQVLNYEIVQFLTGEGVRLLVIGGQSAG